MNISRLMGCLTLVLALASGRGGATADDRVSSLSQYGITWTFAQPVQAGKYVTGDWWVVGPVTVSSVSPAPVGGLNGSVVNPKAGPKQGYDSRLPGYDESMATKFPLEMKGVQSLVSVISLEKTGVVPEDSISKGMHKETALKTAAVLTVVEVPPPADAFRPAYVGTWKDPFTVAQVRRQLLPALSLSAAPELKELNRALERPWIDHQTNYVSNYLHPMQNMPEYGRDMTNVISGAGLALLLQNPDEKLLLNFIQKGIDYYGVVQSDSHLWVANGGHDSGRKWPILFAGIMLNQEGMMHVKAAFAEDEQTYVGKGFTGVTALWSISPGAANEKHEEVDPATWPTMGKGSNNGIKAESYRTLNGPTWIGQALAARIMGAIELWDHQVYFDYVDRWVKEKGLPKTELVSAMWTTYRERADKLGAEAKEKRMEK